MLALCALTAAGAASAQAATLSGTVTYGRDTSRIPIAGATVTAVEVLTGMPAVSTTTASDGTYSLTLPSDTTLYDVTASAPWAHDQTLRSLQLGWDSSWSPTLTQQGWAHVQGTVSSSGGPWARSPQVSVGGFVAPTDVRGAFELWVPEGDQSFELVGDDWSYDGATLAAYREVDLFLSVPERVTVTVAATDWLTSAPVADAHVDFPPLSVATDLGAGGLGGTLRSARQSAVTSAAGEASFEVFQGSSASVDALGSVRTDGPDVRGALLFPAEVEPDQRIEAFLMPWKYVSGTIAGPDGPLEGVTVPLATGPVQTGPDGGYAGWFTDWGITFELPAGNGGGFVTVSDDQIRDGQLDVTLPGRSRALLRVVDTTGAAVAGRTVRPTSVSGTVSVGDGITAQIAQPLPSAVTDADGFAAWEPLAGLTVRWIVPGAGGTVVQHGPLTTAVTGGVQGSWVTLAGYLTPDGAAPASGTVALGGVSARTAADGWFAVTVQPGDHALSGEWDGADGTHGTFANPSLTVARDQLTTFRWADRSPRTVTVVDGGGRPVEGAQVTLPDYDDGGSGGRFPSGTALTLSFPRVETGPDGTAVFDVPDYAAAPVRPLGAVEPPPGSSLPAATFPAFAADGPDAVQVRLALADQNVPEVMCDPPPTGWHTDNVALACRASDSESGLADPSADASFTLSTTVPDGEEDARAVTETRTVCDVAGNCAHAGPLGWVAVDRAAPRIAFEVSPEPLVRGDWWNVSRVAVQVTASDLTGVGSLACSVDGVTRTFAQTRGATTTSGTFYVNLEGRHVAACTATDRLGHVGSAARDVNLDLKNPLAPTATADRPADDLVYGWHRDSVTVSFADNGDPLLADGSAGSGVDPASVPAPQTFDRSGTFTASGTVSDRAGRVSASRSLTVKVDADPPSSTLTCPSSPVTLGASATARWADADGQSGLAGTSGGTVALDTAAVGVHVAEHTAVDRVGHRTTSACTYTVVHPFVLRGGLTAPPALNAVAPGVSTLTVWFSVGGDRGLGILPSGGLSVQPIVCGDGGEDGRAFPATTSGPLAWDAGTGRYAIAWQVAADLPSGGCAALRITLDDGVTREVRFAR
jgi:hypothetical protein